jgi:hypothetical protein
MGESKASFWFRAKRNGLGWGPPCCWQGWAFVLIWLAGAIAGVIALAEAGRIAWAGLLLLPMVVSLVLVVALKGEPLR